MAEAASARKYGVPRLLLTIETTQLLHFPQSAQHLKTLQHYE
jgi:hypothetical protein